MQQFVRQPQSQRGQAGYALPQGVHVHAGGPPHLVDSGSPRRRMLITLGIAAVVVAVFVAISLIRG